MSNQESQVLSEVSAGSLTVRGISVGGIYTSVYIPELSCLFDVGIAPRSFAGAKVLLLSHGHADHVGALVSLLGTRALTGSRAPLKLVAPHDSADDLRAMLDAAQRMQRWDLGVAIIAVYPGDTVSIGNNLYARAIRTYHPVPSVGYILERRVDKLRPEYHGMPGPEIARRKRAGEDLFYVDTRVELAYVTDSLVDVFDREPELYTARVLITECTFLDERKTRETARAGCHIHLDELLERADNFTNEHIVFMHLSQLYKPHEVRPILDRRLPDALRPRVQALVPETRHWPG